MEGKYKSPIKSNEKRMGISLSGLIRGRLSAGLCGEITLRNILATTLRYSAVRKQFG